MFKRRILATAVAAAMSLSTGAAFAQSTPEESLNVIIDKVNDALEAQRAEFRLFSAEVMSRGRSGHRKAVWRKHGFSRADAEFVPFDTRRSWSGPVVAGQPDDITFAIDQVDGVPPLGGLTAAQTTGAIRRAMATWDSVRCSGLVLTEVPASSGAGVVNWLLMAIANPMLFATTTPPSIPADILHAGFRTHQWAGLNLLGPALKIHDDIVAATFTFVGTDPATGLLSDVDNNQKADVAFREIYYSSDVTWKVERSDRRGHDDDDHDRRGRNRGRDDRPATDAEAFDVQTVALHEAGHALSLEHYGQEVTRRDGSVDFKPEAVMNPVYTGTMQRLQAADVAAHCIGGWKTWPKPKK